MEITYIDNASFLIVSSGQKVLMDAHRTTIPREVRELIAQALPPFDDVDLVLATHAHSDHFDPQLVGAHLEQNPNAVFASTEQAVNNLRSLFSDLEDVQGRTRIFGPEEGERIQATLNGIGLEVLNIPHGVPVTNLGFVISIGGRKLLHTGDMIDVSDLESYELSKENIDIALVPYFFLIEDEFLTEGGQSIVLEAIQAEQIVPIHYSPTEWNVESILEELAARLPESILFHEAMETWVLE
jgi:L-ascorbate metabolism protein UlaG (beta-lactamase superfamily)